MGDGRMTTERTRSKEFTVPTRRITLLVGVVVIALNVGNLGSIALGADSRATRYLLAGLEGNPWTWCSAAALGVTAALAWAVGVGRHDAAHWRSVSGILVLLSFDEVAMVHERLGGLPVLPGIGSRAWAGAGLALVALVAWRLLPWALSLEPRLRTALVVGGAVFVIGAIGVEVLAGDWRVAHGEDGVYWALTTLEENLELAGVLVVGGQLLTHLRVGERPLTIRCCRDLSSGDPAD